MDDSKSATSKDYFRRLFGYARPYRMRLFIGTAFSLLCGGSMMGVLFSLRNTLQSVSSR